MKNTMNKKHFLSVGIEQSTEMDLQAAEPKSPLGQTLKLHYHDS